MLVVQCVELQLLSGVLPKRINHVATLVSGNVDLPFCDTHKNGVYRNPLGRRLSSFIDRPFAVLERRQSDLFCGNGRVIWQDLVRHRITAAASVSFVGIFAGFIGDNALVRRLAAGRQFPFQEAIHRILASCQLVLYRTLTTDRRDFSAIRVGPRFTQALELVP